MPRTAKATTQPTEPAESGTKSVLDQIDGIRDALKGVIKDLNQVEDAIKVAEKEKRTTDREIESIRTQLRKIQQVTI